jgi:hypothetical protein
MTDIHRLAAEIGAVLLVFSVLAIGLGMIAASSADAQEQPQDGGNVTVDPGSEEPVEQTPEPEPCEQIDQDTRICGSDYSEETGMAWVVIESDKPQTIVVSDGGSFMSGGTVPQTRTRVPPDERVRISVSYERYEGVLALSVSTRETLWAEIVDRDNIIDQPQKNDGLALLSGIAVPFVGMIGLNRIWSWYCSWGVRRIDG